MDSIFKYGQEVWFTWELDGKSHESFGTIDEVYYFNDVRKHKYRIISFSQLKEKAFYIWEDKISFYKKEDRDELRCIDCKYNKDVISMGRCSSCACSHRLFEKKPSYSIQKLEEAYSKAEAMCNNSEPERKVCKTCKNRECGLAYEPCVICKDHDKWESTKVNPFKLGDLVMYKDAPKPEVFTVIEIIEFHSTPGGAISYSYRIKRSAKNGEDIVHIADHDRLVKVDKQYRGRYIYPVGARVRFKFAEKELIGYIKERYLDFDRRYEIRVENQTYGVKPDSILGYAAEWIDDPSIRKAFGLDIKNDIYENIKKQINKDQLNFHYGLSSIFPLAPNDAAVPFELSEKEKEYVHDDMSATMSYLCHLHKNGFYGTGLDTDSTINFKNGEYIFVNKEDNKMKNTKLIRSNGTYKKEIKNVIFSGPVTTVVFDEEFDPFGRKVKCKTNVRCQDGDEFDKTTGFLLALVKTFVDKQSYDNILRTIDGFEEDKIEKHVKYTRKHIKLEKKCEDDGFKFNLGDIVRLKSGLATFEVIGTLTWRYSGREIKRYRLRRLSGTHYTTYENENRLIKVFKE